jgi:hypothetical protein
MSERPDTLMRSIEVHRVNTEPEAKEIISEAEKSGYLTKGGYEVKQKKSKGEVLATVYKVTIQLDFSTDWFDIVGEVD